MINKEILMAVLNTDFDWHGIDQNTLSYGWEKYTPVKSMNIYELANKCKEWALANGYSIETRPYNDYGYTDWFIIMYDSETKIADRKEFDLSKSEPEAVFMVCQYILDNKVGN